MTFIFYNYNYSFVCSLKSPQCIRVAFIETDILMCRTQFILLNTILNYLLRLIRKHLYTKHIANATSVQIHKSDWLTVSQYETSIIIGTIVNKKG